MVETADAAEVGLLIYPGAQMAAVYGLSDLFTVANRLALGRRGAGPELRVTQHVYDDASGRVAVLCDTDPRTPSNPDIVILPPSLDPPPAEPRPAALLDWLRQRHAQGSVLASVCAGVFLLAEAGLLSGRRVTTHWIHADDLATRFPDVSVAVDELLIYDSDIVSAGGLMAWTDLGLTLVERYLGPLSMFETARFMLVDPPGREQRYYSAFSPRLTHGDQAILKAQRWMQAQGGRSTSTSAGATQAGLEVRTYLRRFRKATGLRPTEYCQQLRVGRARALLVTTADHIDHIAWSVGYEDAASFRKVFLKLTGLTPSAYRRRFGMRPPKVPERPAVDHPSPAFQAPPEALAGA